jgi:hypothetical protein
MARAFSEIAFTDSVRSMQSRYGSRQAYSIDLAENRVRCSLWTTQTDNA